MIPDELKRLKPMEGKERLGAHRDSEYLGSEDIDPDAEPVVTIANLYYGKVTLQRGKENKDVISFVEETVPGILRVRPLIVNSTNRQTLRRLYKKVDAETLCGKQIQLYVDHNVRDPQTGGITDGIRIRLKVPVPPAKAPEFKCGECGKVLKPFGNMNARALADYTRQNYGKVLCAECAKKAKEAADKNDQVQAWAAQTDAEKTETNTEE